MRAELSRTALLAIAACGGVLPSSNAFAQEGASPAVETDSGPPAAAKIILLVRTAGDDGVIARMRGELEVSAWRIVEIRLDSRFGSSPLALLAEQQSATAAIRVNVARGEIEVWVSLPSGAVEEVLTTPGERPPDHVLAVRATETLRARGLNLDPVAASDRSKARLPERGSVPVAEPPAASNAEKPREAGARSVWLELAPAAAVSQGGLGPTLQGFAGVRLELLPAWSASAFGLVPLASQTVEGEEGSAEVSLAFAGGALDVAWLRAARWEIGSGAGLGATFITMNGKPRPGFVGSRETITAATPFVRACVRAKLGAGWSLSGGLLGGATFPAVSIHFETREVATWGRPFAVATLGLEVPLLGGGDP